MGLWATLHPTDSRWEKTLSTEPVHWRWDPSHMGAGSGCRKTIGRLEHRSENSVGPSRWSIFSPSHTGLLIHAFSCSAPPPTALLRSFSLRFASLSMPGGHSSNLLPNFHPPPLEAHSRSLHRECLEQCPWLVVSRDLLNRTMSLGS